MLELQHVDAFYGQSHVLFDISVSIGPGERVAVLGRNGAGKSTLLKSVMNAEPIVSGSIRFDGKELRRLPAHRRAKLGLSLVPEDRRIFPHLTVQENVAMARLATPAGRPMLDVSTVLDQFPILGPLLSRLGTHLSGGQQQMVAIARGFASNPRLLLIDEPTEGLAPVIVQQLAEQVRTFLSPNAGLLLCEQNIWFARQCTTRLYVLDAGQVVFSGSWPDFDAAKEIKERHLAV